MTDTARRSRTTARRGSYLAGALLDLTLLVLINVSPGWTAVPVLTSAAADVVVVVDVALAVALVVNLLCLVHPRRSLTAVGDVVSTAAGLVAVARVLQVFPFTFADSTTDSSFSIRSAADGVLLPSRGTRSQSLRDRCRRDFGPGLCGPRALFRDRSGRQRGRHETRVRSARCRTPTCRWSTRTGEPPTTCRPARST